MVQELECLTSTLKALSSNPSTQIQTRSVFERKHSTMCEGAEVVCE
jgi:hypothetical protein